MRTVTFAAFYLALFTLISVEYRDRLRWNINQHNILIHFIGWWSFQIELFAELLNCKPDLIFQPFQIDPKVYSIWWEKKEIRCVSDLAPPPLRILFEYQFEINPNIFRMRNVFMVSIDNSIFSELHFKIGIQWTHTKWKLYWKYVLAFGIMVGFYSD